MSTVRFFIAGEPKGQPRVKAFVRGKHAGVFDPGTADGWKLLVRSEASRAGGPNFTGPVALSLVFWFQRPAAHHKSSDRARELKPNMPCNHVSKPDADNLAKAVMDALTNLGTYWRDDSQVARLTIDKRYVDARLCAVPGCSVEVWEVSP